MLTCFLGAKSLLSELFTSDFTSRLACQIHMKAQMDGLSVKIAAD
ncbi:hypothetical protein [Chryseobacterium lactis]|nr:hypothetical protein [Chryseobacterium lactis]